MNGLWKGWEVKDVLAIGASSRADTGFHFLSEILEVDYMLRSLAVSAPCSRQMNLLISHNFEMMLDAAVWMSSSKTDENTLMSEVNVNHSLHVLWPRVTSKEVRELVGIKSIRQVGDKGKDTFIHYKVAFHDGMETIVHDLKNIRYDINDFRGKEKRNLRRPESEGTEMDETIKRLGKVAKRLSKHLYDKYPRDFVSDNS